MTGSVALIGYGAIAQAVCAAAAMDTTLGLRQVLVRAGKSASVQQSLGQSIQAIESIDQLRDDTALVIECASHSAVHQFGSATLEQGIDFAIVSAGALADNVLHQSLADACVSGNARLQILAGAIGGIDAMAAAGPALENVVYTARKPPLSWSGSPAEQTHDLNQITTATAIFEGTAREAALRYPKNANVVATVALAGIGFDRTVVSLMADPQARGNSHEIVASGGGYDLRYATKGAALASNPKTSALTAHSVIRAIRGQAPGLIV